MSSLVSDCESCKVLTVLSQFHLGHNATDIQTSDLLQKMCHLHPNAIPRVMIPIHYKNPCSHCIVDVFKYCTITLNCLVECTNAYIVLQNTFVSIRLGQQCNYRWNYRNYISSYIHNYRGILKWRTMWKMHVHDALY